MMELTGTLAKKQRKLGHTFIIHPSPPLFVLLVLVYKSIVVFHQTDYVTNWGDLVAFILQKETTCSVSATIPK